MEFQRIAGDEKATHPIALIVSVLSELLERGFNPADQAEFLRLSLLTVGSNSNLTVKTFNDIQLILLLVFYASAL